MEKLIYLDNAATTLHKPPQVAQAVAQAILTAGNAARGAHGASMQASRTVFETRRKLAQLLGCPRPEQVAFTANSTMALNIAIQGLLSPADHAISTDLEHNSVLRPLYALEAQGMGLSFVRADRQGRIRYEDFAPLFRPNTRAVVCTHASNLTGDMLDIARIAEIAHAHGALLILDASQTAGAIPIVMTALGVDVLCFTGHKGLMGPQGTGGLAVAEGIDVRPWNMGGTGVSSFEPLQPEGWPTRLEAGTLNAHGIAGLSAALEYLEKAGGPKAVGEHERALAAAFAEGVRGLPGITLYGDLGQPARAAIVSLNVGELDSGEVSDMLSQAFGIATRPGAHCAPLMHRALGTEQRGVVRFSFGWFNTQEDVAAAIDAVAEIACG